MDIWREIRRERRVRSSTLGFKEGKEYLFILLISNK